MKKLFIIVALLFMPALAKAQSCDLTAVPTNFSAQLSAAKTGQTLCLATGSYSTNGKAGVTIAAEPGATVSMPGANITTSGVRFVGIKWTSPVCVSTTNVLIDSSTFNGLGQGCNEGRLSLQGNGSGTIISNNTFGGGGASDGIQLTNSASGYHIGPGNLFKDLTEGQCGSVHCDSIQMYGASNTVIDGNWFVNDSTIVMSPDCNGSPITFTNNVVNQEASSAAAALTIGGAKGDIYSHNTMIHGDFRIYGGNPGNCSTNATTKDNLTSLSGVKFVGGTSPTSWAGYALAAGSTGKGAASDGTDLGINVGNTTTTRPASPTNLQVAVQ